MTKKLGKTQKALNRAILSHPIRGAYIAFCCMFTTCYLSNAIALSIFNIGTNDIVSILILSVSSTVALIVGSRINMREGKI